MKNRKGIALILAIGVLAVLAVIATSFALNMRLEHKTAVNYYNSAKVLHLAEAGIERAIIELKDHVKSSAFDSLNESWVVDPHSEEISSTAAWDIEDMQRRINVNTANQALLTNLFNQLNLPPGTTPANLFNSINTSSPPDRGYRSLQELKSKADLTNEELEAIGPYITANSYIDEHVTGNDRSPVNVNTASLEVLRAVLRTVVSQSVADSLATNIHNRVRPASNDPFTSWDEFDTFIDANTTSTDATQIKNNCNPNRTVDKTTTEFCFHSGGIYKITATGTADDFSKTITAIVKIYEIYNETTKDQFDDGTPIGVTWLDGCPVNSGALFGDPSTLDTQQTIPSSIKLGYWDDFTEDQNYSRDQWYKNLSAYIDSDDFANRGVGGSPALITTDGVRCDLYGSDGSSEWTWTDFSLRVFVNEYDRTGASQMKDAARILFRCNDQGVEASGQPSVIHSKRNPLSWQDARYAYLISSSTGEVQFMTTAEYSNYLLAQTGYGCSEQVAIQARHQYDMGIGASDGGEIRIFTQYTNTAGENWDSSAYATYLPFSASDTETFNITAIDDSITAVVWIPGSWATFTRNIPGTNSSGRVVFYTSGVKAAWDDIRIIPANGNYTSQGFNPTTAGISTSFTSALDNGCEWGTITGTWTAPTGGSVTLETSSGLYNSGAGTYTWDSWQTPSSQDQIQSQNPGGTSTNAIRYRVTLSTPSPYQETPVLEDITITYLPRTEILSYVISP